MMKYVLPLLLAAAAPLAAQTPAAPQGPLKLELRLSDGLTRQFTLTEDSTFRMTLPTGDVKKTVAHATAVFTLVVEKANPDGSYDIRIRPGDAGGTVDGKDLPPSEAAEMTATVGRDGRYSNPSSTKDSADGNITAKDFLDSVFDKDNAFPAKSLAVGDRWTDMMEVPVGDTTAKVKVNNKLLERQPLDGRDVARILNIVSAPLPPPEKPEAGVTTTGTVEGGGLSTLETSTGLMVDQRETLHLKLNLDAENPQDSTQKIHLTGDADFQFHVRAEE